MVRTWNGGLYLYGSDVVRGLLEAAGYQATKRRKRAFCSFVLLVCVSLFLGMWSCREQKILDQEGLAMDLNASLEF